MHGFGWTSDGTSIIMRHKSKFFGFQSHTLHSEQIYKSLIFIFNRFKIDDTNTERVLLYIRPLLFFLIKIEHHLLTERSFLLWSFGDGFHTIKNA
jgi:hypothetical protein